MKKLIALVLTAVFACSLCLTACGEPEITLSADNPLQLTFAYAQPPKSGFVQQILVPWATDLEQATGGRIKIVHQGGGALLGGPQVYDGVLSGVCDLAVVDPAEQTGRLLRGEIMSLPLLWPNGEVAAVSYHEFLNKYCVDTELKDVKLMITCPMPEQNYLGNKEVKTLEDFKGLKMRGAGKVDTAIEEALGATAIAVSTDEAYSALNTGMVDGQFFSWEGSLIFGFGDVTTYKTECYIYQTCFQLLMNKQTYEKLPSDVKKIFDEFSTPQVSLKYAAKFMASLPGARGALEGKGLAAGKPPIYVLPAAERDRWVAAVKPVVTNWIADVSAKGLPGQEMYDYLVSAVKKNSP